MNSAHESRPQDAAPPAAAFAGPPQRHIRSFAMRRGHVTQGQRRAYEDLLPAYAVPFAQDALDFAQVFGNDAPVVLEIGFGMGETTAAIAQAHPEANFVGVEVFVAGIGALARRAHDEQLRNLRIVQHDAVEVVARMIAPASLAGVHVFFPDPWPKARHHKRRLIAQPFAGALAERLRPGGYLHCATDWEDYARQMLEVLGEEPRLVNRHATFAPRAANPLCDRPTTKFHARGSRLGHGVWDLVYERKA